MLPLTEGLTACTKLALVVASICLYVLNSISAGTTPANVSDAHPG